MKIGNWFQNFEFVKEKIYEVTIRLKPTSSIQHYVCITPFLQYLTKQKFEFFSASGERLSVVFSSSLTKELTDCLPNCRANFFSTPAVQKWIYGRVQKRYCVCNMQSAIQRMSKSQNDNNHQYRQITKDHTNEINEGIDGTLCRLFNIRRIITQPLYGLLL